MRFRTWLLLFVAFGIVYLYLSRDPKSAVTPSTGAVARPAMRPAAQPEEHQAPGTSAQKAIPPKANAPPLGVVRGTVRSVRREPIAGATVTLVNPTGAALELVTSESGRFELVPAEAGWHSLIEARADGYLARALDVRFYAAPGLNAEGVDVALFPTAKAMAEADAVAPSGARLASGAPSGGASMSDLPLIVLEGVVRDADSGAPLPHFAIEVSGFRGDDAQHTDAELYAIDGRFSIGLHFTGRANVRATAPLHAAATTFVDLSGGSAYLALALPSGGRISGHVFAAGSGAPLAGARVALERADDDWDSLVAAVLTDAAGVYSLPAVTAGRRTIVVSAEGYVTRLVSGLFVEQGGVLQGVDVTLQPGKAGEQEMVGIGVALSMQRDGVHVNDVLPQSGAANAGLAKGDVIVAIDGEPSAGKSFEDVVEKLRGMEGTIVELDVRKSDGTRRLVSVRRGAQRFTPAPEQP